MTVIARRFRARPFRTSHVTLEMIRDLICHSNKSAKAEFDLVAGYVSSLISDEVLKEDPVIVRGNGPRLRIYCVYDEDAISDEEQNEDSLRWDPLSSDWKVYLPCPSEDLDWMRKQVGAKSAKFVVYDRAEGCEIEEDRAEKSTDELLIDAEGFRNL